MIGFVNTIKEAFTMNKTLVQRIIYTFEVILND